jgi:mannose-6-phosphate isomerase
VRRIDKPWGHEIIWAETSRYVGKILHVNAGQRLSLQYHRQKEETLLLRSGEAVITLGEPGGPLQDRRYAAGEVLHVPPGLRHRLQAVTDCEFIEVSTTELDDVVRLSDDYGRSEGPEAV